MITNERQYRAAKTQLERFALAVEQFDERAAVEAGIDPLIARAQGDGLREQLRELRREVAAYEGLSQGGPKAFAVTSIMQIPPILIKARIASGLSQRALAERVGLKEQQVQRYEAERYQGASLARLHQISNALSLKWQLKAESVQEGALEADLQLVQRRIKELAEEINIEQQAQVDAETSKDEVLVARANAGSRASFSALLSRHYNSIHRQARRIVSSPLQADNVTQDVCVKLATAIRDYPFGTSFSQWLSQIVSQTAFDALRADLGHAPRSSTVEAQARTATQPQIERVVVHPQSLDFDVGEEEEVASPSSRRVRSSSSRSSD